jgi:hypothetical protein
MLTDLARLLGQPLRPAYAAQPQFQGTAAACQRCRGAFTRRDSTGWA